MTLISGLPAAPLLSMTPGDVFVANNGATTSRFDANYVAYGAARLGLNIFNVLEYGAVADSGTNCAAAFQAAIDACAAAGGGVVWAPPDPDYYLIGSELTVSTSNVWLRGGGGDTSHNVGAVAAAATTKLYTNFSGYPINFISPTPGGASEQKISGGGMSGFVINGADLGKGLKIRSVNNAVFEDLSFAYCNTSCIDVNCVAIDDPPDSQYNVFRNLVLRCHDAADTGCHGMILDGAFAGNTSINTFERIIGYHKNGDVIKLLNCDNNTFRDIFTYRVAGTGYSMSFHGAALQANIARENIVDNLSCDSAARFYGTGVYTFASQNNIVFLDNGNTAVYPVMDAGAYINRYEARYRRDMQWASGTPITPDPYLGEIIKIDLTAPVTINLPTVSAHIGKKMTFLFVQDATGRAITFNAAYRRTAVMSTVANTRSTITFAFDGFDWTESASSVGV
jgi:hypothetical protein